MGEKIGSSEFIQLLRKPVPLIKPFIQGLWEIGVYFSRDDQVGLILGYNQQFMESYILSLAVRHAGDNTGILAPLIGVSRSKFQTKTIVNNVGTGLLAQLDQINSQTTQSILSVLDGKKNPDINDLQIINSLIGEAVRIIKAVALETGLASSDPKYENMTETAFLFRDENRRLLEKLIKQFGGLSKLLKREAVFDLVGNRLVDIYQAPIIPKIKADPLLEILPDELNRNINPTAPEASSPLGLIAKLNMAGNDVVRYYAYLADSKLQIKKMEEHYYI